MKVILYFVFLLLNIVYCQNEPSECITKGWFPKDSDPACRGFTICTDVGNNSFTPYTASCPEPFLYDPLTKVCSNATNYQCNNTELAFKCSTLGLFKSTDCKSFFACITTIDQSLKPKLYHCPAGNVFSPLAERCVNETDYDCVDFLNTNDTSGTIAITINSFIILNLVLSVILLT